MKYMTEPVLAAVALTMTGVLLFTRSSDMSDMTTMMLLGLFTVVVLAYAAFIFKESPADEREFELSLMASKYAYLAGAAVLTAGIVVQSLDHSLDAWLPVALVAMVVSKSLAYFVKK